MLGSEFSVMSVAGDQTADAATESAVRRDERRAAGVACGAHALHDGFTDVIFVLLPVWQREFGLGYAEVGMLRGIYAGTMATFQIPAALLAERLGTAPVLALGTALAGIGYCLAGVEHRLRAAGAGAVRRRARRQRPASARLGADRARLCRAALAEGARHLQFRRRHRQDDACRRRPRSC